LTELNANEHQHQHLTVGLHGYIKTITQNTACTTLTGLHGYMKTITQKATACTTLTGLHGYMKTITQNTTACTTLMELHGYMKTVTQKTTSFPSPYGSVYTISVLVFLLHEDLCRIAVQNGNVVSCFLCYMAHNSAHVTKRRNFPGIFLEFSIILIAIHFADCANTIFGNLA